MNTQNVQRIANNGNVTIFTFIRYMRINLWEVLA